MTDPRSAIGSRTRRARLLVQPLLAAVLGGALLLSFGVVNGLAADKSIEATGSSLANYAWTPSTASISTGGTVEFKNSTGVLHAVEFVSPPSTPSCPGVPSTGSGSWSGTCTFSQAGTYQFHCTVHPTQMTGTITVTGGPTAPVVTTEPAGAISDTGATLNGKVNPSEQATTYYFKWGTSTAYGNETAHESAGSGNTAISESAALSGLTASTTYHYKLIAENSTGTSEGADRSFTTAGPPTATTEPATSIGGLKATLVAMIDPNGLATTYHFNYGTTPAYGQSTAEKPAGSGTTSVSKSETVTGLSPDTTYHFQVVAKSTAGEREGADLTFTTPGAPLATTGAASGLSATGATVEGTVNPEGQPTTYFFNYGPTTAYGQKTAAKSAGEGITSAAATAQLTELLPDTTYHFQLVAENGSGPTPGADQTFLTGSLHPPPPPVEETVVTPPPPPPPPPPVEASPPDTKITSKPAAKTHDRTPTIKFSATVGGSSFQCSVDSKAFKPCRSPFTTPSLKPGRHRIRVEALAGGLTDPTPASVSFKVLGKKK